MYLVAREIRSIYFPQECMSWNDILNEFCYGHDVQKTEILDFINQRCGPRDIKNISFNHGTFFQVANSRKLIKLKPIKPILSDLTTMYVQRRRKTPITTRSRWSIENYEILLGMTVDQLRLLLAEVQEEFNMWMKGQTIFDQAGEIIEDVIAQKDCPHYDTPIIMNSDEIVNNYRLWTTRKPIVSSDVYKELLELLNDPSPRLTYEEFIQQCGFCTEWHKMDDNGESYQLFWNSDDPNIKSQAWDLSFDHNTRKLYELPFHTSFLKKSVDIGCSNRMESVRYSNFLGVWVQRKSAQLSL